MFFVRFNQIFNSFQVRRELGVPDNVKLLIFNFGGQVSTFSYSF